MYENAMMSRNADGTYNVKVRVGEEEVRKEKLTLQEAAFWLEMWLSLEEKHDK